MPGSRDSSHNPKNGSQRVVTDADGSNHLQSLSMEAVDTIIDAKSTRYD
ncbi:MAG: hypothetical protein WBL68_01250 [Nitrososphaeraceae archaeon]